jgi:hypothetical protein
MSESRTAARGRSKLFRRVLATWCLVAGCRSHKVDPQVGQTRNIDETPSASRTMSAPAPGSSGVPADAGSPNGSSELRDASEPRTPNATTSVEPPPELPRNVGSLDASLDAGRRPSDSSPAEASVPGNVSPATRADAGTAQMLPSDHSPPGCSSVRAIGDGLFECEDGLRVRTASAVCSNATPRSEVIPLEFAATGTKPDPFLSGADAGASLLPDGGRPPLPVDFCAKGGTCYRYECYEDADCDERPYGYCSFWTNNDFETEYRTRCLYGCVTDADCDEGLVCDCADPVGECHYAGCRTSDDCPNGSACASSGQVACGTLSFVCTGEGDQCHTGADCQNGSCLATDDGLVCNATVCLP